MQKPANLKLTCYQGANFDYSFLWKVGTPAAPVNLTNYTARMQVREAADCPDTLLSLTSGTGITLGGTAGSIYIEASSTATAALPSGYFVYDLEMIDNAGYVTRLVQGVFEVDDEVTR